MKQFIKKNKIITLISVLLFSMVMLPSNAATKEYSNDHIKLKSMAKLYVKTILEGGSNASKQKILQSMMEKGASNFQLKEYTPSPQREEIKIDGQVVDSKNKSCVVIKYKYNGNDYETGACKSPFEK